MSHKVKGDIVKMWTQKKQRKLLFNHIT